ncbi:hypothetical protein Zmor_021274 [Zophobas morio]|uniref:Uncharacterized protein n=1 Tax=Zophobas morio TaxID=2755281 RepID=A0AA38I5Y3_9CUCU|nr:hypothetical protein Zmor_021274 [Zophobas morio]
MHPPNYRIHGFLLHAVNAQQHVMLIWTPRLYRDPPPRRPPSPSRRPSRRTKTETDSARGTSARADVLEGRLHVADGRAGTATDLRKLNALDWSGTAFVEAAAGSSETRREERFVSGWK